jgi:predicted RNA binding protein YcfA (HicA-like mRNA interferase family)
MTRLPALPARRVVAALERAGFRVIRIKGSHCFLRHQSDPTRQTIVPLHRGDLPAGTLRAILRQARLTAEELLDLL